MSLPDLGSAVFFATILPALILAQIEPQYITSRMTFNVSSLVPGRVAGFT
jgi:hypothetical protein